MRDNIRGGALTETTFFILLALFIPNHGYGIMQFIENETYGRLVLGARTFLPDISIQPTIKDYKSGTDIALDYVLAKK